MSPTCDPKDDACIIWGDPHIISFDIYNKRRKEYAQNEAFFRTRNWKDEQATIVTAGTFWLVKSAQIHIQAHYESLPGHVTAMQALAIGGPFLDNGTLIFRTLGDQVTWNGEQILQTSHSTFNNGLVNATYDNAQMLVKDGTRGPGIKVILPAGVRLNVNRWRQNLAAEIKMPRQDGGQSGQCGNYDGDWNDDEQALTRDRLGQNFALVPHAALAA